MKRLPRLPLILGLVATLLAGGAVYAQLEGADRGVPPIDSASTFEVTGVEVDVAGPTAEKARQEGWREAQAKAWRALWAKTNGRPISEAPNLPDSTLNGMVSGIVVENEQIGPKRYIATLGVLFDRARTGQLLGVSGPVQRSAPMLVIPVMLTGSSFQSFESRTEWQKAWARFRTVNSPVDYVRPTGSGIDPLLLNVSQTRRPGRGWWRMLLDQYGAADVIVPEVHLHRLYPGGPATAMFVARAGPDNRILGRVQLKAENGASIARLFDEGVRRLDQIYSQALAGGQLAPDPSLVVPEPPPIEEFEPEAPVATTQPSLPPPTDTPTTPTAVATSFSLQVDTPNAAAVNRAELSVSRIGGVTSALTTSLALGGTSVMRVTYMGDSAAFQRALEAQGWRVSGSGSSLRISRGGGE
ncbi:heavy-metal-associated domain-containing protein [Sphingosinicella sp. BN140058]|uniref:heavy-metal-associated domain-containing protein n=1 Tax=Sphingosinicella sp. BN140058 TaxID=1892855 RepID=UPI001FB0ECE2|nr:heavy-metal-associated domain-containing protein [Sphingosinicella sp. BN140058]